jgi:DNA phosphorothioation-associated putative methyltransferase
VVGKRVSGDLYVHRSAIDLLDEEDKASITDAIKAAKSLKPNWNVVRLSNDNIALLNYPGFDDEPFPTLKHSVRIDLLDGKIGVRNFEKYSNPPILHRKELLVADAYPRRAEFAALTEALDTLGIFYDAHTIGFRQQWTSRLSLHGVLIDGHKVIDKSDPSNITVQRHKTALVRYQLSQPVQLLMRYGLLKEETSFFDYGCGRGDDVDTLMSGGIDAIGWDPHYAPNNDIEKRDIINIGFVLNVIESIPERHEALRRAWSLADKVLAISVMSPSASAIENAKPYKDGFLTTRGTFQKYYSQDQLRDFITSETKVDPIAVAPGIFFAFADEVAKQEFQITRYERDTHRAVSLKGQREKQLAQTSIKKIDRAFPILEHLAEEITALGRPLHPDEVTPEITDALKAERISYKVAEDHCLKEICEKETLEQISAERRDDLILYFALELFSQHRPYRQLPKRLQQDLKAFWGNYGNAQIEARQLLFSIGDKSLIKDATEQAADDGLGYLLEENQLQFHRSILKRLPLALRCYVACGSVLYGDVEGADAMKVHVNSGKLTLQFYENFSDPLPLLIRRIKIDMRSQRVRIFDYDDSDRQYLFMKSLFLPEDHEDFERQSNFDREVTRFKEFDFSGYGPDANLFDRTLSEQNLRIDGYSII